LLGLGIIMTVLGVIGLGMVVGLTLVTVIWFGALLLIGGGVQVFDAFSEKTWRGFGLHLAIGLLYVAGGALTVFAPGLAAASLTLIIAAALVAAGAVRTVMALQMRNTRGWPLLLIGGILSVILGAMIFAGWPASGLWVLGLFVAIELIMQGVTCITLALAARRAIV
jgi:uncharacterized membrane protein HdeD (DUF308 family)